MRPARRKSKLWEILVSPELDRAVERAIERGHYFTKSELVRAAVRRELLRLGIGAARQEEGAAEGGRQG